MDDKTSSTAFGDSSSTTHNQIHSLVNGQPPSPYQSTSISGIVHCINRTNIHNMDRSKNPMDIKNSLMSPPEPIPEDSFYRSSPIINLLPNTMPKGKFQHPLSPPVSPATKTHSPDTPITTTVRDPILFPSTDSQGSSPSQPPLFPDDDAQQVVNNHIQATPANFFPPGIPPPRKADYMKTIEFVSSVYAQAARNPRGWGNMARAQLEDDQNARRQLAGGRKYTPIAPATSGGRPRAKPQGPRTNNNGGVQKPVRQKKVVDRGMTPDGPVKVKASADVHWSSLPDFCPPLESLGKVNKLTCDWKGSPKDLTDDPDVHLLHPFERELASRLRLTAAQYLASKRRIFIKRIEAYNTPKDFRKTDAQQACKIDVNKASKLWQAFEKAGWFHEKWIEKYV
ncbi:SWIRM domain-containing protein [Lachnellula suecica]|uniref:SWIRM domain-containing protein n=1 Tax=Lachnellula suecica TaxID=602035 RepID=A0A8T9BWY2_9HELO|nr:SWIRM domain-containing protein [Lachnellula suecica]